METKEMKEEYFTIEISFFEMVLEHLELAKKDN